MKTEKKIPENTQEVMPNVLIIIQDPFFFEKIFKPQLEGICNLIQASSFKEAAEKFELMKQKLDFVVVHSCLEDSSIDTIELSKKMKKDRKFNGVLIAVGNHWKKMVGKNKCNYGCLTQDLVKFLTPLILDLTKKVVSIKNLQKKYSSVTYN